jgi:hypothetical protein
MKILPGRRVSRLDEAALLAFQEAGLADMSPEVAMLFAPATSGRGRWYRAKPKESKEVCRGQ